MKSSIFVLLSVFSTAALACNVKPNPNKVVLFVDTNASFMEADAARKAACARGETFEMIPGSHAQSKALGQSMIAYSRASEKAAKDGCYSSNAPARCKTQMDELAKLGSRKEALESSTPKMSPQVLNAKIKALADSNKAIHSVVFSGHDGGGSIHGAMGGVNKTDFFKAMNSNYAKKPNLLKEFKSALMWGCFTSTPQEVAEWKASFPGLKIMAGFYGVGPANTRQASSDIMEDILKKEGGILNKDDAKDVKAMLAQLQNIQYTNPGIYAMTECGKDYYYYKNGDGAAQFGAFKQFVSCDNINQAEKLQIFNKYYGGEVDVPKVTQGTELRELYNFVRQNAQCFNAVHPLDGDHVGNLLFFNGVKENFGNVFANLTKAAQAELKSLNQALNLEEKNNEMSFVETLFGDADKEQRLEEVATFRQHLAQVQKQFFMPTAANLKTKSRAEILKNISLMEPLVKSSLVKNSPAMKKKMVNMIKLQQKMQDYLHQLKPSCMDFLDWHEAVPNRLPQPRC